MPRTSVLAAVAIGVLAVGALAAVLFDGGEEGERGDCIEGIVAPLTPPGEGANAYTMGIRVNQPSDVGEIESAIGDRILDRDVFLVNTEYQGTDPDHWRQSLSELNDEFPCNRVASLNGLGTDSSKPGYMKALVGEEGLDAVLIDWEQDTWEAAGLGPWDPGLPQNLTRINERFSALAEELKDEETAMGIVPDYIPPWDYGRTARLIGQLNWELDPAHLGYQIVQTQPNCGDPAAPGPLIGGAAAELRDQYRPLFGLTPSGKGWVKAPQPSQAILQHLGFEVAFSTTPNPNSSEPVERIGPEQAARCSDEILRSGGAAILYWADADSLKAMLDTSVGQRIRPSGSS